MAPSYHTGSAPQVPAVPALERVGMVHLRCVTPVLKGCEPLARARCRDKENMPLAAELAVPSKTSVNHLNLISLQARPWPPPPGPSALWPRWLRTRPARPCAAPGPLSPLSPLGVPQPLLRGKSSRKLWLVLVPVTASPCSGAKAEGLGHGSARTTAEEGPSPRSYLALRRSGGSRSGP